MTPEGGKRRPLPAKETQADQRKPDRKLIPFLLRALKAEVAGFCGWKKGDFGIKIDRLDLKSHYFEVTGFDLKTQQLVVRYCGRSANSHRGRQFLTTRLYPDECRPLTVKEKAKLNLDVK